MMHSTQFETQMHAFLRRQPFKPFVIELDDGTPCVIERRETVSYYTGRDVWWCDAEGAFHSVDCENVRRLVEYVPAASAS